MQKLTTESEFRAAIRKARIARKWKDVHVHVMPICTGEEFARFGLYEAAAYHYLDGEAAALLRRTRDQQRAHSRLDVRSRAIANLDAILGRGVPAVSTAATGWFRMADALGLDTDQPYSDILREWDARYASMLQRNPGEYQTLVFERSYVSRVVSTQSIFNPKEAALYLDNSVLRRWDEKFEVAIRFDEALRKPQLLLESAQLAGLPDAGGSSSSLATHRALMDLTCRHVDRFTEIANAPVRYISASIDPRERFYDEHGAEKEERFAQVMRNTVIPLARKLKLPIFLMPHVIREVNPDAGSSGDCVGTGDTDDLVRFISRHPDVSFILTALHPTMNYNFCFLTRACPNVRIIGYWWGNLNSNQVQPQSQERFEFIGTAWFGFNSDARILDQLLYKWDDYFDDTEEVLATRILPASVQRKAPVTEESVLALIDAIQNDEALFAPLS